MVMVCRPHCNASSCVAKRMSMWYSPCSRHARRSAPPVSSTSRTPMSGMETRVRYGMACGSAAIPSITNASSPMDVLPSAYSPQHSAHGQYAVARTVMVRFSCTTAARSGVTAGDSRRTFVERAKTIAKMQKPNDTIFLTTSLLSDVVQYRSPFKNANRGTKKPA